MSLFLRFIICIFSIGYIMDVFAGAEVSTKIAPPEIVSHENIVLDTSTGTIDATGTVNTDTGTKQETAEEKQEKEKTINDINTFLIESYKLKIDKILSNLNISLERVTNNDPIAQAQLLEKIRGDIDTKIQIINSRKISENRKIILSSIFSYIQENLNAKISKLVQQK